MATKVVKCHEGQELEKLILESWYLGERYVIKGEGFLAAIVLLEDLATLEEIEKS